MQRARDWYAVEAPAQIDRLEAAFDEVFDLVTQHPEMFAPLRREARRAHLAVFPYDVWYRVHPEERLVDVIAVVHDRQDRGPIFERLV